MYKKNTDAVVTTNPFSSTNKYCKLEKEQEMELWQVIKTSNNETLIHDAELKILSVQYSMLVYMAKKRSSNPIEIEDLIAIGLEICVKRKISF